MVEPSTILAGAAVAAGAVGWAEKRYRDMRQTLVELRVNQQWLIDHTTAADNHAEGLVGDGGDAQAVKDAIDREWSDNE